jgi:hypothetical protein
MNLMWVFNLVPRLGQRHEAGLADPRPVAHPSDLASLFEHSCCPTERLILRTGSVRRQ